jgi:hypothetical protein
MKLSERYWQRLVEAREVWRICRSWLETVQRQPWEGGYAWRNEIAAHFLCMRLERLFLRACHAEESRLAQRESFDAFKQHRMPLP